MRRIDDPVRLRRRAANLEFLGAGLAPLNLRRPHSKAELRSHTRGPEGANKELLRLGWHARPADAPIRYATGTGAGTPFCPAAAGASAPTEAGAPRAAVRAGCVPVRATDAAPLALPGVTRLLRRREGASSDGGNISTPLPRLAGQAGSLSPSQAILPSQGQTNVRCGWLPQ